MLNNLCNTDSSRPYNAAKSWKCNPCGIKLNIVPLCSYQYCVIHWRPVELYKQIETPQSCFVSFSHIVFSSQMIFSSNTIENCNKIKTAVYEWMAVRGGALWRDQIKQEVSWSPWLASTGGRTRDVYRCAHMRCSDLRATYLAKKEAAAEVVVVGAVVVTAGVWQGEFVCDVEFVCEGECVL